MFQFIRGPEGPQGPPGVCACNATMMLAGMTLPDLITGPPGIPGKDGRAGPPGTSVRNDNITPV
jgi:hypothetical protein